MKFMLELLQGKNEDIGLPKVDNHVLANSQVNSDFIILSAWKVTPNQI